MRSPSISISPIRRLSFGATMLEAVILGAALLALLSSATGCAAVSPPSPAPPFAPLVSTTIGHLEQIADDAPGCVLARSLWRRTVEEFARTHVVPSIPADAAVDECH